MFGMLCLPLPHQTGRSSRILSFVVLVVFSLGFIPESSLANTVVKLGTIRQISGPLDIDLEGEFVYAINFSSGDPVRTVRGVKFVPDFLRIPGATLSGPQVADAWLTKPEFGSTPDDNQLEEIFYDIRWANTGAGEQLRASLTITNSEEYKLQILICGNGPENRRWDIRIAGQQAVDEITSLGASPGQSYAIDRATLYTYQFVATTNRLVIEMGSLFGANDGGDRNPIWQALTLEHILKTPSPDDILLGNPQFFSTQTAAVGHLDVVDRRSGTTHTVILTPGDGDTDNAKFTLLNGDLLPQPFDFSTQPSGTPFTIRVRATDNADATRFLEKAFSLIVFAPSPPTEILLDASSISSAARPGDLVAHVSGQDPYPFDRFTYALTAGPGDNANALFSLTGNALTLAQPLPAGATALSLRLQAQNLAGLTLTRSVVLTVDEIQLRVNELLAGSRGGLTDETGAAQDWIELYNNRPQWVNLGGYYLTDQPRNRTLSQLPATSIRPYGFLLILADGVPVGTPATSLLHASFSLNSTGGRVALVASDGLRLLSELHAPGLFPGVSYGIGADGNPGYMLGPTPGQTNGPTSEFGLNEVAFSVPHGYFTNSFLLELSATVPGSIIHYTTNGSLPTLAKSLVYSGPILVRPSPVPLTRGSRVIRAFAESSRAAYGPVQTQTYLFINGEAGPAVDGVVGQSSLIAGITRHAVYGPLMDDALLALPAVSVVMAQAVEVAEHPASIELIDPSGQEPGFQIDCGISETGTSSLGSPKQSMAAKFKTDFGRSKLQYPVFAQGSQFSNGAATEFKSLRLRSHSHDTFYWLGAAENPPVPYGDPPVNRSGDAQLARNPWIDEMQLLMGQPGKRGRQVHLFLNGEYHGLYHLHEHPDEDFMATYYPGGSTDFQFSASAAGGSEHGLLGSWRTAWTPLKASLANYAAAQRWIDMTNLCDYMLLSFYAGNDWDWGETHNWAAAGPQLPDRGGWKFFEQDSDLTLQDVAADCTDQNAPDGIFTALMKFPDFRILFRDRAYRHCYNDGMLTPARAGGFYDSKMNELTNAIIAETARWQPSSSVGSLPWDRDQEWANEWKYLREAFFPQRTARLLAQFRKHPGWWPVEPPELGRSGGVVPLGTPVPIIAENGVVYITTDGSDPRLPGGGINPAAQRLEAALLRTKLIASNTVWRLLDTGIDPDPSWKTPGFDDSAWRSGPTEIGYGDGGEATVAGFIDTNPLLVGVQKNITTYFRQAFDAPGTGTFSTLRFRLVRDDGAVVYLNGVEVWRSNMPVGVITPTTRASRDVSGTEESTYFELDLPAGATQLQPFNNLLAVEVHQGSPASPDMSFNFELIGLTPPPGSRFIINQPTLIRARTYLSNDWSGLVQSYFVPDTIPSASAANLLLSEIHYNPADGSATEFLEFLNTANTPIDLSEVTITQAVVFRFPQRTMLAAGERIVVAKDLSSFTDRYSTNNSPYHREGVRVVGPWTGSLANEGDTVSLLDAQGKPLFSCLYGSAGPWPFLANGKGASLELADATAAPLAGAAKSLWLSDPANWRASSEYHGSPGGPGLGPDGRVVINELLAASVSPATDFIEFLNTTSDPLDIGGWVVSDSADNYRKYRFPDGAQLAPRQRLVLTEADFNKASNPASLVQFAFSSKGEQVHLLSTDSTGALIRFVDGFVYGPVPQGVVIGRWPDATGPLAWLQAPTLGGPNASPLPSYAAWTATAFSPGTAADLMLPAADPDGDGISNFGEYAFVLSPWHADASPVQAVAFENDGTFVFAYRKRTVASEVTYHIEISADLIGWHPAGARVEGIHETPQPDASTRVVVRLNPGNAGDRGLLFVRVLIGP